MVRHGRTWVFNFGSEPPAQQVICDVAGDPEGHRFYSVVWSDAPPPDSPELDRVEPICGHCAIEEHPELGRPMDMAVEHRYVCRDEESGEWVPTPEKWEDLPDE